MCSSDLGGIERDEEFWWIAGRELEVIRDRRAAALSLRKASMISTQEYQLAVRTALREAVAMPREELIIQTARLFKRTASLRRSFFCANRKTLYSNKK